MTAPPIPPRPRRRQTSIWLLALASLIVASFATLNLQWRALLTPQALRDMAAFTLSFFPPETTTAFLQKTTAAALETLAMSLLGTLLAAIGGLLLALPASLAPPSAAHRAPLRFWHALVRSSSRMLLNGLRAVPELVWAVLLLIAAGLGPMAGTLALAIHTTGVLGRLFAESIENAPPHATQTLRQHGASNTQVLLWATLPQITPQLLSYTLYRWENNIRAATVLGIVGAGGLGQMLSYHLGLFHMPETGTVLLAMLALVALVDACSFALRRALAQ